MNKILNNKDGGLSAYAINLGIRVAPLPHGTGFEILRHFKHNNRNVPSDQSTVDAFCRKLNTARENLVTIEGKKPAQKSGADHKLDKDKKIDSLADADNKPHAPSAPSAVKGERIIHGVRFSFVKLVAGKTVSDIYDAASSEDMSFGSVNSGNSGLEYVPDGAVGGSGINSEFKKVLDATGCKTNFQEFHAHAIAQSTPGVFKYFQKDAGFPEVKCFSVLRGRIPCHVMNNNLQGSIVISVFNDDQCPLSNKKNKAMIYVYPPNGYQLNQQLKKIHGDTIPNEVNIKAEVEFLKAVEQTGHNMIKAVEEHNQYASSEDKIEVVRLCGVSSGAYAFSDHKGRKEIENMRKGIDRALSEIDSPSIKVIQIPENIKMTEDYNWENSI